MQQWSLVTWAMTDITWHGLEHATCEWACWLYCIVHELCEPVMCCCLLKLEALVGSALFCSWIVGDRFGVGLWAIMISGNEGAWPHCDCPKLPYRTSLQQFTSRKRALATSAFNSTDNSTSQIHTVHALQHTVNRPTHKLHVHSQQLHVLGQ